MPNEKTVEGKMVEMRAGIDREQRRNLTGEYNTRLADDQEQGFTGWIAEENKRQGRDLMLDLGDYDVRGFWAEGLTPDERNHGSDKYKKPSHPTFSEESVYHKGEAQGGQWVEGPNGQWSFHAGPTNREYWDRDTLANYFAKHEPDVRFVWGVDGK